MNARELLLRYRKDPRFIISVPLLLLAATSIVYYLIQQTKELTPEALSSQVLLFVLWNINIILILGILFVLLRGIVKLVLERQRGMIGSRFRTKLVVTYVATSLLPVILLFVVATDLLRVSIDRWFTTPVRTILTNGNAIAQMAQDQAGSVAAGAAREIAAEAAAGDAATMDSSFVHALQFHNVQTAGIYRDATLVRLRADPRAPIQDLPDPPARFFDEVLRKGSATKIDVAQSGGKWVRSAVRMRNGEVAVAGVYIPQAMNRMIDESIIAYRNFQQLYSQRQTLKASQTSLMFAVTLAILFGTLWTSIYASRRITIPIKALAEATEKLAEGGYGHRVEVVATDEVGRLIESFNDMSTEIAEQRDALTETNRRLDRERSFMQTVLDSVATGIITFSDQLAVLSVNRAAQQMLHIEEPPAGTDLAEMLRGDLAPVADAVRELTSRATRAREVTLIRGGELRYLELAAARLGGGGGWVMALEDSTQLVQAQKLAAWNEAARRIAHEIKNPLTPIQLSAERIAKKFRNGDSDTAQAVEEGTRTIVAEVTQLKRMVDEFSRFARMPAVHMRHAQLAEILQQAASLYSNVKPGVTVSVAVDPEIELLMDPEQISRAAGNLLKNAVEATEAGEIRVTARRAPHRVVIEVADPGRGVPDSDKEKLFLPYFSTKGRGTGLGLAIVHRIVNDHDGRISVHDNH
ncbi:MAG: HAMP domain-containing protein, partial [Thermoanaerobaculia bacterium]|nr:HAMP domain-containing protein [Thermoanaerobaculia bacterium]